MSIYYRFNNITKEYIKTKNHFNDRGFDRDGIYCAKGEKIAPKTKILEYSDGVTRTLLILPILQVVPIAILGF